MNFHIVKRENCPLWKKCCFYLGAVVIALLFLVVGGTLFNRTDKGRHFFGWLARKIPILKLFTVRSMEELAAVPHADELLAQTDLLVDGPYVQELDDGKSLRGSSNQRVHLLTPRYAEHLHLYGAEGREAQVFYHGAKTHRVGIPTDNKYTY